MSPGFHSSSVKHCPTPDSVAAQAAGALELQRPRPSRLQGGLEEPGSAPSLGTALRAPHLGHNLSHRVPAVPSSSSACLPSCCSLVSLPTQTPPHTLVLVPAAGPPQAFPRSFCSFLFPLCKFLGVYHGSFDARTKLGRGAQVFGQTSF